MTDGWAYDEQALAAKAAGDPAQELRILLAAVEARVDTPYSYDLLGWRAGMSWGQRRLG